MPLQTVTLTKTEAADFRAHLLNHRDEEWAAETMKILRGAGEYRLYSFEARALLASGVVSQ